MSNKLIDAVKTANAIHNGDYSSLRGKSFVISDNIKKKKGPAHPGDNIVKKSRIDKLEERIDKLEERIDKFEGRFDRIEESITKLAKQINARFDNLEKDVNSLKQNVKDINTRIDRIDARLDYNGLKKLPESKTNY